MQVHPRARVTGGGGGGVTGCDGGDAGFDGARGRRAAAGDGGEVEKATPCGCVSPPAVGRLGNGFEIGLEGATSIFRQLRGGDGGLEPVFARQGSGRRRADHFGERLVEVGEVGVALLYDVGAERKVQSDVVLCEGFSVGWGGDRGCWDSDFDGRCHGVGRSRVSKYVSFVVEEGNSVRGWGCS